MFLLWRLVTWPFRAVARNARPLFAAVLGYGLYAVVRLAGFAGARSAFGAEWLFDPVSWNVSGGWIGVGILAGIAGALIAGLTCQLTHRQGKGTRILILLIAASGLLLLLSGEPATAVERVEAVTHTNVLSRAIQPAWVVLLSTGLAVVGALAGSRLVEPGASTPSDPHT